MDNHESVTSDVGFTSRSRVTCSHDSVTSDIDTAWSLQEGFIMERGEYQ